MIFIILSVFLFSLNNVLWKKNLQQIPLSFLVATRAFFTSSIALILVFSIYGVKFYLQQPFLLMSAGSIFGLIGLISMLSVIKNAPLLWLGIYNLSGVVLSAAYLIVFERHDFSDSLLGFTFLVLGFLLFLFQNKTENKSLNVNQHLLLVVMTCSFFISSLIHWKNLSAEVPALIIISNQELIVCLFASSFMFYSLSIKNIRLNFKKHRSTVLIMAFIIVGALFFSLYGLKQTNPVVSGFLFLANPLITVILASILLKENMKTYNWISFAILSIGAFLLHLNTN